MNLRDTLRGLLVKVYARRVEGHLDHAQVPEHIGVIVDGSRRWAKAAGSTTVQGHQAGANKIEEFLGWCTETDVKVVTLWLLSTDNFNRPKEELVPLLGIIEDTVRSLAADGRWSVHHVGALDLLSPGMQRTLKEAEEATADVDGILVNVAIGYGGRQEIADAVLFLHDLTRVGQADYQRDDDAIAERLLPAVGRRGDRLLHILNKCDLPQPGGEGTADGLWPGALRLSARSGQGLDALRDKLLQLAGWHAAPEGLFIARKRHVKALDDCRRHVEAAHAILADHAAAALDLLAEELRLAQRQLSLITGEFSADDLLGEIFSRFCIGK